MSIGIHHWHKRHLKKSVAHKKDLQSEWMKELLDKLVYLSSITAVAANVPQLYTIWFLHKTDGVSEISWITFFLSSLFWLFYGYVHKSKPIILLNTSLACVQLAIVVGILIKP